MGLGLGEVVESVLGLMGRWTRLGKQVHQQHFVFEETSNANKRRINDDATQVSAAAHALCGSILHPSVHYLAMSTVYFSALTPGTN